MSQVLGMCVKCEDSGIEMGWCIFQCFNVSTLNSILVQGNGQRDNKHCGELIHSVREPDRSS